MTRKELATLIHTTDRVGSGDLVSVVGHSYVRLQNTEFPSIRLITDVKPELLKQIIALLEQN